MKLGSILFISLMMHSPAFADRETHDGFSRTIVYEPTRLYLDGSGELIEITHAKPGSDYAYGQPNGLYRLSAILRQPQLQRTTLFTAVSLPASDRLHASSLRIAKVDALVDPSTGRMVRVRSPQRTWVMTSRTGVDGAHVADLLPKGDGRTLVVMDAGALEALTEQAKVAEQNGNPVPKQALLNVLSKIAENPANTMDLRALFGLRNMNANGALESEMLRTVENSKRGWVAPVVTESIVSETKRAVMESGASR